ncbi:MAG: ABC transporter ATP-binding protein [Bacteroidetes bacterium]|nr:ABC transporter ATP-binding protein [Bacteroidota bacterium]
MPEILRVQHLTKKFSEFVAVDDLSFTVNKGDVYGFLGQNGAGKSTTIRMLLSLITPTSGSINIFGEELAAKRSTILRQVGAIIEKPDLYLYLSAYENLSIFARMSGITVTKKILMDQLEMVGLAERAGSKVETFSQGMKQRLGIAVALVHNPGLIILDEPTNGLDPQGIADMRNLILHLSREGGKTIVVSSHLLSEIEIIANRILIIDKGKKVAEGEATALLDPSKTIVKITTADDGYATGQLQASAWANNLRQEKGIVLLMHKDDIPSVVAFLIERRVQVLAVTPQHSLENYFLSLTNQTGHVEAFSN